MRKEDFLKKLMKEKRILKKDIAISNNAVIDSCKKQVEFFNNSQAKEKISYEIQKDCIKFSNGQFLMFEKEVAGTITKVRSKDFIINDIHYDIKDVIRYNDKEIITKYSRYIIL